MYSKRSREVSFKKSALRRDQTLIYL